jgi:hypothetical protein
MHWPKIIYTELIEEDKFKEYLFIKIINDQFDMSNRPTNNTYRVM